MSQDNNSIIANRSEDTLEVICVACEEGRSTLDHQIESLRQIDKKAIRILRANILLIGLILTALSVAMQNNVTVMRFLNLHTLVGATFLVISSAVAAMTYLATEFDTGLGAEPIREASSSEMDEEQLYSRLAKGYADWIEYNESAIRINGLLSSIMIVFVINSLALLSSGVITGILNWSFTQRSFSLFLLMSLLILLLNIFIYKLDLWIETHYTIRKIENGR